SQLDIKSNPIKKLEFYAPNPQKMNLSPTTTQILCPPPPTPNKKLKFLTASPPSLVASLRSAGGFAAVKGFFFLIERFYIFFY
ncbi:MAG: hypothetical protein AAFR83_27615, partial [Cyanobacteria bacterium J06629_18]